MHIAWPGTPSIYTTGTPPHSDAPGGGGLFGGTVPLQDAAGVVDPTFGGILGYGTATLTHPDDGLAPKGPWAAVTDTGVIIVTNWFFPDDDLITALAAMVATPVTVFDSATTIGQYSLRYYVDGTLERHVTDDENATSYGQPLPYEVEIAESWWGEDYTGELMFQDLFHKTTGAPLDILSGNPITCTEVLTPPLLPAISGD